jgi:hypothetical protein
MGEDLDRLANAFINTKIMREVSRVRKQLSNAKKDFVQKTTCKLILIKFTLENSDSLSFNSSNKQVSNIKIMKRANLE